jgi:2-keto-3-deoxy-L-rhamnonate aldolase RhmA
MAEIIPKNKVKAMIAAGQVATGCFVAELRQPTVATLLALGGLDFMLIDNEHGPWTVDRIAEMCTSARHAGITPFVRVPDYSYAQIAQSLDAGAQGLIFPRIETAQQVRDIVQIARYPPTGKRGPKRRAIYCTHTAVCALHLPLLAADNCCVLLCRL